MQRVIGPEHPDTLRSMGNLAMELHIFSLSLYIYKKKKKKKKKFVSHIGEGKSKANASVGQRTSVLNDDQT